MQHIFYLFSRISSLSWLRTMRFVMNSLTYPARRERCRAWLRLPFQVFLHCFSPAVFAGTQFDHITPAHLHKLKQGNVIYLLSLAVPFSWLSEITANINRGYKKGLWTLERVDYAMNQFINGGPWSDVGARGIYSFIKQCLQHLSSPESRALKCNKAH